MAFQPGQKRPAGAGRKKGQVTKDRQMLLDKSKELGVDVFEILLLFAGNRWEELGYESDQTEKRTARGEVYYEDRISPDLRVQSAGQAAQYVLPKLKAIEVQDIGPTKIAVTYVAKWGNKTESSDDSDENT